MNTYMNAYKRIIMVFIRILTCMPLIFLYACSPSRDNATKNSNDVQDASLHPSSIVVNEEEILQFLNEYQVAFENNKYEELRNPFSSIESVDLATNEFNDDVYRLTIDSLKLVGIVNVGDKKNAIVKDNKEILYRVEEGGVFSEQLIRVGNIANNGIEILKYSSDNVLQEKIFLSF